MRIDRPMTDMDVMIGMGTRHRRVRRAARRHRDERRGCPMDDLVSDLGRRRASIESRRLVHETGLVISGGAETTRTVIARGLRVLADHPDQWEAAAADPGAGARAGRGDHPLGHPAQQLLPYRGRTGAHRRRPTSRAGDRICLVYPSANRDETVFADPFTFDIRRSPNPQVAFGGGTHFCLGVNLARTELRILFARAGPPHHEPPRGHRARHRAERLRRRGPILSARVRRAVALAGSGGPGRVRAGQRASARYRRRTCRTHLP